MVEEEDSAGQEELPTGVGEKLRSARLAKGMSLGQVSARTKITQRHIEQIESGDFGALPGRTYVIGFSRSIAKAVGLEPDAIAREVREELAQYGPADPGHFATSFEPGDPARVPSARIAWISALAALVVFVGGSLFLWTTYIAPAGSLPWPTGGDAAPAPVPAPASSTRPSEPEANSPTTPVPAGQVAFTALAQGVWVKFYDGNGRTLMQKQMDLGETYIVPADASDPQLWTGRPDALAITIGGKSVPKLAEEERTVKDVPVSAEALLARGDAAQAAGSPTG